MAVPMFRNNVGGGGYSDPTKGIREGLLMMKMAQDSKDKNARLAMIDARDQRRYDLQQKRLNAKDARDASLIQGNLAAARATMTDPIDMYKTKMVEDRSNVTGREWDATTANANADKISVVDAFAPKAVKPGEKAIMERYNKILENNKISDLDKENQVRALMLQSGVTQDELDEEDSVLQGAGKKIMSGLTWAGSRIGAYNPTMAIAQAINPDARRSVRGELAKIDKLREDELSYDDPMGDFRKKMKTTFDTVEANKTGKAKYDAQIAKQKAELDLYAKKDKYGQKSSRVLKDRANYQKELNKKIQREITKIPKGLAADDKAIRETQIYNAFGKELAGYSAEKSGILKFQQDMQKEDLKRIKDNAGKAELAKLKSALDAAKAKSVARAKNNLPQTPKQKAELTKLNLQIKKLEKELD